MKLEELKKLLKDLEDDDLRPERMVTVSDELEKLYNECETLKNDLANSAERIRTLQETNGRLALRITSPAEPEPNEPKEKTEEELEKEATEFFENLGREFE